MTSVDPKPSRAPPIRIERVTKRFGPVVAVEDLSLEVGDGELVCFLGPSGCGKTTMLRMLAGFEHPDRGRLLLDGVDLAGVPPHRRPVNMMFQSYALFPHLSVRGNVAFGLKREGMRRAAIARRVEEVLDLVQMNALAERSPAQLSGGQKQRVALARAIAKRPRLLLLDEPLGALDRKLREETQAELKALQRRLGTAFVVVTHDQSEAMAMADRVVVMNEGRLVQAGPPRVLYNQPATRFVADFIGHANLLDGIVAGGSDGCVDVCGIRVPTDGTESGIVPPGTKVTVAIRPERIVLDRAGGSREGIVGRVAEVTYLGGALAYRVVLPDGAPVRVVRGDASDLRGGEVAVGDLVRMSVPSGAAVILRE